VRKEDRGAIAVLTAILAFVLFGVSALAVDLGNMYARSGDAQTAADLAALAGAGVLVANDDRRAAPSASDATRAKLAAYASLVANPVFSDDGAVLPAVTSGIWTDGNDTNGEINVNRSTMRVTVVIPPRTVRFGLAAVFGVGESSVTARAVAEVRAPGAMLPFYVPDQDGCRTEPQFMAVPPDPPGDPKFQPPVNGPADEVPLLEPDILSMDASGRVTIVGDRFEASGMSVQFTRGKDSETVDDTAIDLVEIDFDADGHDRLRVHVPPAVSNTPGEWVIRVENSAGWGGPLTPAYLLLVVDSSVIDECGENPQGDLALFAPPGDTTDETDLTDNVINGITDGLSVGDEVTIDPADLTVDKLTAGLVTGTGALKGRLDAPATPGCNGTRTVLATQINDDKLSCFLDNVTVHTGHNISTLKDDCDGFPSNLNDHIGRSLLPSIFNSPRFFFVPVLDAGINPTGFADDVAVNEFRAVFLTGQWSGGTDEPDQTDADNGLSIDNKDKSVDRVTVYAFCPDELPNAVDQGGNGFPWQPGLPTVIRLVE
jgi:Flp pilus assembly protein TadG